MNKTKISNTIPQRRDSQRCGHQSRDLTHQSRDRKGAVVKPIPLAYFITFSCYGTHLHGHKSESVDRSHNKYGAPHLVPDEKIIQREKKNMNQDQYVLDHTRAKIVLDSIMKTSSFRKWNIIAVHVRSTHVHVVIQALATPEKIMNDLKSYASRLLNNAGFGNSDRKRWARHGSTRYLWKTEELTNVIQYVLHEQGDPMVVYENECLDVERIFTAPSRSRL